MNRFFKKSDLEIEKLIFDLEPNFWWSRRYEYPFALNFVEKDDIVLDCCCGTYHPFKFELVNRATEVYAMDLEAPCTHYEDSVKNLFNIIDKRFGKNEHSKLKSSELLGVHFSSDNITKLKYDSEQFDKIFCISSLEHMDTETIKSGLLEMKRVLKDSGTIVLTIDYPTLKPETLIGLVGEVGLKINGEYNYDLPTNAIESTYFGGKLNCYNMVLVK